MDITIRIDNLEDGQVIKLLDEHHREMHRYSPSGSIHALDSSGVRDPSLTFWSARDGGNLAACGALKELSPGHGEIKSMRTADGYQRRGLAARILKRILEEARRRRYARLSLETGTNEAFFPAVTLYQKYGFRECGPFGNYGPDPYSRFFTLPIKPESPDT
jgi:putative acetyltransferase